MEFISLLLKLTTEVWKVSSRRDKVLAALGVLIMISIFYGVVTSETTYETKLIETAGIYSLSLNDNTEMNFVLGTGSSRLHYNYYFFKNWDEGKRLDFVDASVTKIIETDEHIPTLKRYETVEFKSFYLLLIESSDIKCYNELIVPTNTTQTSFTAEV